MSHLRESIDQINFLLEVGLAAGFRAGDGEGGTYEPAYEPFTHPSGEYVTPASREEILRRVAMTRARR